MCDANILIRLMLSMNSDNITDDEVRSLYDVFFSLLFFEFWANEIYILERVEPSNEYLLLRPNFHFHRKIWIIFICYDAELKWELENEINE